MSWILCLAIVAIAVDLTPPEPRAAAVKVFFNERLGPLEIDRMGLGQGGLSDEPMWDNRVPEIRALRPRLVRLFIQEYFNLLPKRDQYHFEALDRSVDTILKTGGKPLMCICFKPRLLFPAINQDVVEPNDYPEWERLVVHLVKHYRDRGAEIRFWEVANEPDIGESGGCPYRFQPENYVRYYRHTASAILRGDPDARVGGPALANVRSPILPAFLKACDKEKIPAHFISWHIYSSDPPRVRFNSNGNLDIVTADPNGAVSVLLGNGNGTFQNPLNYATGFSNVLSGIAVGDFNQDGYPDLAAVNDGSAAGVTTGTVSVLMNAADWSRPQPSSFAVSGFPSPTTAGLPGSFTVTAKNADGTNDTSFTGTVQFTSSDGQASLPADYTFTTADAGMHTFSATLYTADPQSITATDFTTGLVTGTDAGITVTPAAASKLSVASFPSPTTAGVAGNITVIAHDPYGNLATGYTGTLHFTSSDSKASLPANYTFTAADAGVHIFSATLKTAGTQSITATDTTTASLTGTDAGIAVYPAMVTQFIIIAPSSVTAGAFFNLTVKVEDAYGNIVTNYTSTIHFSSTDPKAKLPNNYTFTAADGGIHTFSHLVLRTKGYQKITITDTLNSFLFASDIIDAI